MGIHECKFFEHALGPQFELRALLIINGYAAGNVGKAWA